MDKYFLERQTELPFEEAAGRVREKLKEQGFGVLTEIDVRKTLEEKLGKEMPPYLILGACNPPAAYAALEMDPHVGTLLPCNVVVRKDAEGKVFVAAVRPSALLPGDTPEMANLAAEIERKLQAALDGL